MTSEEKTYREYIEELWPHVQLYRKLGFNIFPLKFKSKEPFLKWKEYQERKATEEELEKWFKDKAVNVAIICGKISGNLFVLDFDNEEVFNKAFQDKEKLLNSTLAVKTGRGYHVYFKAKKPVEIIQISNEVTVKGEGSYVVAAPSIHPSGKQYKIISSVKEPKLIDNPDQLTYQLKKLFSNKPLEEEEFEETHPIKLDRKKPYCIKLILEEGVEEGERNERAFDLARYYYNRGKSPKEILKELRKWNKKNKPPLDERELKNVVKSVVSHRYAFGCGRLSKTRWCHKVCPYFKERKSKEEEESKNVGKKLKEEETNKENTIIDITVEKEAERILTSDDPLEEIKKLLEDIGIVGEDENKQIIFTLLLSGKINDPKLKQIILLKGEPGAGKSTLMKIADFFNVKDVGRFTEHALDYTNLSQYEVLRLKEIGKMDEEKYGVSTLKFLSADDQGYTVEYTVRNENGRFTTESKKIPPITVITGTTRVDLDSQFERRAWIINPDESEEQTKRILEAKARMIEEENRKKLGVIDETSKERAEKILRKIVELLEPCTVIVPFPKTLTTLLRTEKLRVRGDYDKIYALIYCYHFLLQKKLGFEVNGKKLVVADPYYTLKAIELVSEPLTSMFLELDKRARMLIQKLEELGITQKGETITKENREELARRLGKSERTIRRYLNSWEKAGYLSSEGGRGKPKFYTLLYSLEEIKNKEAGIFTEIKSTKEMIEEMMREARELLNKLGDKQLKNGFNNMCSTVGSGLSNHAIKDESWTSVERPTQSRPIKKCPTQEPQQVVGQTRLHGEHQVINHVCEMSPECVYRVLKEKGGELHIEGLSHFVKLPENIVRSIVMKNKDKFVVKWPFIYTKEKYMEIYGEEGGENEPG